MTDIGGYPVKIRILVLDEQPLLRHGISAYLNSQPDMVVCGEADNILDAGTKIAECQPQLLVTELRLGAADSLKLLKRLKAENRALRILVYSAFEESIFAERAMRAGAMGYVMKHEPGKIVKAAIHKVLQGEIYLSERMSSSVISKFMRGQPDRVASPVETLSDRELEVFRMLGQGKGTRQISRDLNVTIATVNSFRNRIKEKLGLKTSTEVMLHAIQWCREDGPGNAISRPNLHANK